MVFWGDMHSFFWGACIVFFGGACVVFSGGRAWCFLGDTVNELAVLECILVSTILMSIVRFVRSVTTLGINFTIFRFAAK